MATSSQRSTMRASPPRWSSRRRRRLRSWRRVSLPSVDSTESLPVERRTTGRSHVRRTDQGKPRVAHARRNAAPAPFSSSSIQSSTMTPGPWTVDQRRIDSTRPLAASSRNSALSSGLPRLTAYPVPRARECPIGNFTGPTPGVISRSGKQAIIARCRSATSKNAGVEDLKNFDEGS